MCYLVTIALLMVLAGCARPPLPQDQGCPCEGASRDLLLSAIDQAKDQMKFVAHLQHIEPNSKAYRQSPGLSINLNSANRRF
jgi:hypothetical protein